STRGDRAQAPRDAREQPGEIGQMVERKGEWNRREEHRIAAPDRERQRPRGECVQKGGGGEERQAKSDSAGGREETRRQKRGDPAARVEPGSLDEETPGPPTSSAVSRACTPASSQSVSACASSSMKARTLPRARAAARLRRVAGLRVSARIHSRGKENPASGPGGEEDAMTTSKAGALCCRSSEERQSGSEP